jgi:uncharacterized damage-inducible protein DinB
MLGRPGPGEYAPYYDTYIGKVPQGAVVSLMESELAAMLELLRAVPSDRETYAYAPGKWSIREVVGHVIDVERLFAYRALTFARGDAGPLPGMEQNDWAAASNAAERPLPDLLDEFEQLRRSHVAMFGGFDEEIGRRRGVASGNEFSVRALAHILVGHEIHHRGVLQERYLTD